MEQFITRIWSRVVRKGLRPLPARSVRKVGRQLRLEALEERCTPAANLFWNPVAD